MLLDNFETAETFLFVSDVHILRCRRACFYLSPRNLARNKQTKAKNYPTAAAI